jgi:probable F420-dependent oxidoreductase
VPIPSATVDNRPKALSVKFMIEYPVQSDVDAGAWLDPERMTEFARAAESAGFDALALTDHPAPSMPWIRTGGHETLDPFAGLSFFAATTTRISLMTWLTVLPYRNPLLLAKSMTSLDVLSGGRTIFVCGTGYLRGEFRALGVDFDDRNALFDEAMEVLRGLWSATELNYDGLQFTARRQTMMPQPVSFPYPALWVGGNSEKARERVATWGLGWSPLIGAGGSGSTLRTAAISGEDDFVRALADLRGRVERHGRSMAEIDVMIPNAGASLERGPDAALEELARQSQMGVTWTIHPARRESIAGALDDLHAYGESVIAASR